MMKVSGHVSGTVCGGVSEDAGLEKADVKEAGSGNETQYLAFIALKNIAVGREPPWPITPTLKYGISRPDDDKPEPKDQHPAYAISEPKNPKTPRDFPAYAVHEPREKGDKW